MHSGTLFLERVTVILPQAPFSALWLADLPTRLPSGALLALGPAAPVLVPWIGCKAAARVHIISFYASFPLRRTECGDTPLFFFLCVCVPFVCLFVSFSSTDLQMVLVPQDVYPWQTWHVGRARDVLRVKFPSACNGWATKPISCTLGRTCLLGRAVPSWWMGVPLLTGARVYQQ